MRLLEALTGIALSATGVCLTSAAAWGVDYRLGMFILGIWLLVFGGAICAVDCDLNDMEDDR